MEEDSATRSRWTPPALEELMPDLSREEQNRFRDYTQHTPSPSTTMHTEQQRDAFIISTARNALRHYNARHPGGEFDIVKPLMRSRVGFRGQVWFHINFWARSRSGSNRMIKRFFAEVHNKPSNSSLDPKIRSSVPIVEICTIIEEPFSQYRRSCAFCPSDMDIFHPKGCRKFVCGNDKDRIEQRLKPCNNGMCLGMPFTCLVASPFQQLSSQEEEKRRENSEEEKSELSASRSLGGFPSKKRSLG